MTVSLHAQCRARLVEATRDALLQIQFEHNSSLSWITIFSLIELDAILPKGRTKVGLVGEFSDRPVMHFVTEQIARTLAGRPWQDAANAASITTLPEFHDVAAAAERLVAAFETLPWQYELYIETPLTQDFREFHGDSTYLGRGLTLFLPTEQHAELHDLPKEPFMRALTRRDIAENWNAERYYLRGDVTGFIGRVSSRGAVQNFISKAKSLAGFLLALEIVEAERPTFPQWNRRPVLQYRKSAKFETEEPGWLADEDAYIFQNLTLFDASTLGENEVRARRSGVNLLTPAFGTAEDRLINAARWYFDSFCGSNELLSFVQAMIVLEILFGEKGVSDVIGIANLIANRCAYLIGKTTKQREEIIGDINRIYETRSAIVHRGKDALTPAETSDFHRLRTLCRLALRQELLVAYRGSAPSSSAV